MILIQKLTRTTKIGVSLPTASEVMALIAPVNVGDPAMFPANVGVPLSVTPPAKVGDP